MQWEDIATSSVLSAVLTCLFALQETQHAKKGAENEKLYGSGLV